MDRISKQINDIFDFLKFNKSEKVTEMMTKYIELLFSWHKTHNIIGTNNPIYF